ncbi:Eco47II family restriction endonuclease [Mycoplasma putrefaciens]|uniref:Eco47II family restriction endonuclease n=1 Tax=Mycoplasma putrefaciens TaxID=2123 RepID=UPI003DA27170
MRCNFQRQNHTYYVEIKNKHNTLNRISTTRTYMRMKNYLLNHQKDDKVVWALVEVVITKKLQNISWFMKIDNQQAIANKSLRRIFIDKFYEIVTDDKNSFKNLYLQLSKTLEALVRQNDGVKAEKDSVF